VGVVKKGGFQGEKAVKNASSFLPSKEPLQTEFPKEMAVSFFSFFEGFRFAPGNFETNSIRPFRPRRSERLLKLKRREENFWSGPVPSSRRVLGSWGETSLFKTYGMTRARPLFLTLSTVKTIRKVWS
jgi:hypothetical protein